ncbi:class I SAM-dependent methyltransferase [soil metagenome]
MDIVRHNSAAWDKAVDENDNWTVPVGKDAIARARVGDWSIVLTPEKAVPRSWFGEIEGKDVLCLASGGGQQAPILAAAGAAVTSFDNSAKQLEQDKFVAEREGLSIRIEQGDAADLSRFDDASFDLIFNPCSNLFMPDLRPIWSECFRVLRPAGHLLAGIIKPEVFIFDRALEENEGILRVRHSLPYADETSLTEAELAELIEKGEPLEFSHTLESQIGGQIDAGFHIVGLFEDNWDGPTRVLNKYMPTFIATRALKPK